MSNYLAPGVYLENLPGNPSVPNASPSTCGVIGITERGPIGVPILVTSWDAYLRSFAQGVVSPFIANSDLAYAVYGFFQNGGSRLYVSRVASATAEKAELDDGSLTITAKDEGAWGNALGIIVAENEDSASLYNVTVTLKGEVAEFYSAVSNSADHERYWIDHINARSNLITAVEGALSNTTGNALPLINGKDGITDVADDDYIKTFPGFDFAEDMTILAIPGQTSKNVVNALLSYCELRKNLFAVIDAPRASGVNDLRALRKDYSSPTAAIYYPWIKVNNPLSKSGASRDCPPSGHVMGTYSRIISNIGVWRAPAGTIAQLKGALDLVTPITNADIEILNPLGIICVAPKTNYGIVVWGARCITPDTSMLYVSDVLLDIYIKKSVELMGQPFVFEPNNPRTWSRLQATIEGFLDNLWRKGGLYGTSANEAYMVRCDEDLNPPELRDQGQLICEVGYAGSKPSEFVIFRFSHTLASAN